MAQDADTDTLERGLDGQVQAHDRDAGPRREKHDEGQQEYEHVRSGSTDP